MCEFRCIIHRTFENKLTACSTLDAHCSSEISTSRGDERAAAALRKLELALHALGALGSDGAGDLAQLRHGLLRQQ